MNAFWLAACLMSLFADGRFERSTGEPKGKLLLAGGGTTGPEIVATALKLAGGEDAPMLVVPQASQSADAGASSQKYWQEHGAKHVEVLDLKNKDAARAAIAKASFIWMPGGDQSRLVKALKDADMIEPIRKRYQEGAVVGGTSAGAAAASGVMLTGGADLTRVLAESTPTAIGLDLWSNVIVDQHFIARNRFNRLLSAVLDHPNLVGVGVDERTAVVVRGSEFEVVGEGQVVVIDARPASVQKSPTSQPQTATSLSLHVLKSGMKFDLKAKTPEKASP